MVYLFNIIFIDIYLLTSVLLKTSHLARDIRG